MQPVREWLGSLGLSEYADSFDRNRIDLSVGRTSPTRISRSLVSCSVIAGGCCVPLRSCSATASTAPCPAATPELKLRDEAERRQVTVMFVDFLRGPLPQSQAIVGMQEGTQTASSVLADFQGGGTERVGFEPKIGVRKLFRNSP